MYKPNIHYCDPTIPPESTWIYSICGFVYALSFFFGIMVIEKIYKDSLYVILY